MKKIFALTISLCALTSVFAQYHNGNDRMYPDAGYQQGPPVHDVYYNSPQPFNSAYNKKKERDENMQRVICEYQQQINMVNYSRRLRGWEKDREIAKLERERDQRLHQIWESYSNYRNDRYDDRFANNDRRY